MLTDETLDRLGQDAARQIGLPISTGIAITPGELLELVRGYRELLQRQGAADEESR